MNFEEWADENLYCYESRELHPYSAAKMSWNACKREALKILDAYHNTPAYPYIKAALEKSL